MNDDDDDDVLELTLMMMTVEILIFFVRSFISLINFNLIFNARTYTWQQRQQQKTPENGYRMNGKKKKLTHLPISHKR